MAGVVECGGGGVDEDLEDEEDEEDELISALEMTPTG